MGRKTTLGYLQKIRNVVSSDQFQDIAEELFSASGEELEAFWNIIYAGYSTDFALSNYTYLYNYVKDKNIEYSEALKIVYSFYPSLDAGIFIKQPEWYELN